MYAPYDDRPMAVRAVAALRRVRARTWLILGGAVFGIIALLVWAGISILSWLWGQMPVAADAGNRFVGEAMTQIEKTAPGLKDQVDQWVPGLKQQVEQLAPGLKQQVEQLVPSLAALPPASDVSGTDLGPVPRFSGLVRSAFSRSEGGVDVRYLGPAAFEAVRAHYVQGFTAAGYAQEVMEASPDAESHRFTLGEDTIAFSLLRLPAGRVEVRLKTPAQ